MAMRFVLLESYAQFVSIDWSMIFTLVNTLITFLIVKKFLYNPVKKIMKEREDEVHKMYEDADKSKSEAEGFKSEYETRLLSAKQEATEIVSGATRKAQLRSDEIISDANQKASNIMQKAEQQIEKEKKKAVNEIKNEISDMAVMIAAKVVEKEIDKQDHEKMIEQFIENAGDEQWPK